MGKYGEAAIDAVKLFLSGRIMTPLEAWEEATIKIFGLGTSSQLKGCPRDVFLSLCAEGFIKGIPPGNYTRSEKNKEYAIRALEVLKENPELSFDQRTLWRAVAGVDKSHNQQMDIVTSLWNNRLIKTRL